MNFGPTEWLIILAIVLVLFGGTKVPKLARSFGHAVREFEKGIHDRAEVPPDSHRPVE